MACLAVLAAELLGDAGERIVLVKVAAGDLGDLPRNALLRKAIRIAEMSPRNSWKAAVSAKTDS